MTTFTICIPCVDKHIEQMEKMLDSLKHHTIKPNKVITSISPRYLNLNLYKEKERLEKKFPFLLCLVQDKPTGIGENINHTFKYVDTDYVTIWGADDFFHPQYLEIINYIIINHNPNIIVHIWDYHKKNKKLSNPDLKYNINVFDKINIENIKTYSNFYLRPESTGRNTYVNRFYEKNIGFLPEIHYGMQTFKTYIVKENKYKVGPEYDYRSDSLYLVDMYKKYGKIQVIYENLIQYFQSNTCG